MLEALADGRSPPAFTTDFVLDETLTLLRRRGARSGKVVEAFRHLLSSPMVTVLYVDHLVFEESLALFERHERLSFTDAVTLAVMRRHGIKEIFSHDSDFDLKGIVRKERP